MRPHTASRRTHARPRLEAATLRVRAVTKVRAYVARLMQRVAAGEAPAATGTARGSSTATVRDRSEAMRACCRTRARRAASRESARRAVERCWADETDSEAEAVPLGCGTSDLDALRIARNRLAADVERLRTLAREGDATAARRASSEALIWLSYCHLAPPVAAGAPLTRRPRPWGSLTEVNGGCLGEERQEYIMSRSRQPAQVMVPSDPWVRDRCTHTRPLRGAKSHAPGR